MPYHQFLPLILNSALIICISCCFSRFFTQSPCTEVQSWQSRCSAPQHMAKRCKQYLQTSIHLLNGGKQPGKLPGGFPEQTGCSDTHPAFQLAIYVLLSALCIPTSSCNPTQHAPWYAVSSVNYKQGQWQQATKVVNLLLSYTCGTCVGAAGCAG